MASETGSYLLAEHEKAVLDWYPRVIGSSCYWDEMLNLAKIFVVIAHEVWLDSLLPERHGSLP